MSVVSFVPPAPLASPGRLVHKRRWVEPDELIRIREPFNQFVTIILKIHGGGEWITSALGDDDL